MSSPISRLSEVTMLNSVIWSLDRSSWLLSQRSCAMISVTVVASSANTAMALRRPQPAPTAIRQTSVVTSAAATTASDAIKAR